MSLVVVKFLFHSLIVLIIECALCHARRVTIRRNFVQLIMDRSYVENDIDRYFDAFDYVVFAAMLIVSALIGVYFAWFAKVKQNTTSEYLMGGKTMGIFPISMSLIARYVLFLSYLLMEKLSEFKQNIYF